MKRIVDHWCIYYVWIYNYFQKKKNFKGATGVAGNFVLIPILLYVMFYLVVPVVVLSTGNTGNNFIREHSLMFKVGGAGLVVPIVFYVLNNRFVKSRVEELLAISNWEESPYYKRGKRIVLFHLVFIFLSIPISVGIGILIL